MNTALVTGSLNYFVSDIASVYLSAHPELWYIKVPLLGVFLAGALEDSFHNLNTLI